MGEWATESGIVGGNRIELNVFSTLVAGSSPFKPRTPIPAASNKQEFLTLLTPLRRRLFTVLFGLVAVLADDGNLQTTRFSNNST